MNELPPPLVASDVDLRDFGFMPLDVRRLLTSETWIEAADEPKVGHAALSLWCEAWHQVPAASLPDNDKVLARLAMCSPDEWAALKPKVLRGFVQCSDGRYYHPVVAEKAIEAWKQRQDYRAQREADRERLKRWREAKRRKRETPYETGFETDGETPYETSKTGTGTGIKNLSRSVGTDPEIARQFEIFWRAYPSRREHSNPKKPARAKFEAAVRRGVDSQAIIRGARNYAATVAANGTEPRFVAQAVTWVNQERWNEYQEAPRATGTGGFSYGHNT